jgi:hypothetical protein
MPRWKRGSPQVVNEKQSRLRVGMRMMGLRSMAFWTSWAIYGIVFSFVISLLLSIVGHAAGFQFFTNTNFLVPVLLYVRTTQTGGGGGRSVQVYNRSSPPRHPCHCL